MPTICRTLSLLFLVTLAGLLSAGLLSAEDLSVGQRVEFTRAGQTFSGTVISIRGNGNLVEVETEYAGQARKLVVAARNVRAISPTGSGKVREWVDATGKHKITAELVSQSAFDVKLKKPDGLIVTVPIDKLSVADQEFLATLDGDSSNPFAGGAMSATGASSAASAGGTPSAGTGPAAAVNGQIAMPAAQVFNGGQAVALVQMPPPQNYVAERSPLDLSALDTAAINVPPAENGQAMSRPWAIDPTATTWCYTIRSGRDPVFSKVYAIDGKARKTKEVVSLNVNAWVGAANPVTGDIFGGVNGSQGDRTHSMFVLTGVREGNPRVAAHWKMFPNDPNKSDYVVYRRILSNKVVIVAYSGSVQAFNYEEGRKVWSVPSNAFNEPAISPNEKYVAVVVDKQCAILDSATGQQLGSIPVHILGAASIGFSNDGSRIAVADGLRVRIFDVASGKETMSHEANVGLVNHGKPVLWLNDQFLLLPTGALLNIERNLIVWNYNLTDNAIDFVDLPDHGLFTFKSKGLMTIVRLPHEAAENASNRDTSNIAALRQGDPIGIDVRGGGPGANPAQVQQWLRAAVEASGYRVDPNAASRLVASITQGETETRSYRSFGSFGSEDVQFTPYISKAELKQRGTNIWQNTQRSSMPFMVDGNKSLDQVAREYEKPNPAFFQNLKLPKEVLKPEFQRGFGSSTVGVRGVEDQAR